jgi:hypothetical protein
MTINAPVILSWTRAGTPVELHSALETLGAEYPLTENGAGLKVTFRQAGEPGRLCVRCQAEGVEIAYGSRPAALRGVAHALAGREADEVTAFSTFGIMLDCSRNAVMTVPYLKKWMRRLSLLGYNMVMLYTENTYELPDEPYFGYMRGAYSAGEVKELDAYAVTLGMELVACIQTLGHMEQILKWGSYRPVMDTEQVLLVDGEKTYELIEKMVKFWAEALGSRRIHVGMDEAHSLGRGVFMDQSGYERPFDVFNRHLRKVGAICEKYSLKPLIWSDMYFRMSNPKHDYYDRDSAIPEEVKAAIPRSVDLVYWDYCSKDEAFYSEWIRRHRELGGGPVMASGIWTWARFWYDHKQTVATVTPCLNACSKAKVREFLFTLWGDGGGYCEYDSALAGLTWGADLAFGGTGADGAVAPLFAAVCGGDYRTQLIPGDLQLKLNQDKLEVKTPTMMWDDPLFGIGWAEYQAVDPACWSLVLERFRAMREALVPEVGAINGGDLSYALSIVDLLVKKLEFRRALVPAYEARDRAELLRLVQSEIPQILEAVDELQKTFRRQWLRRNKPFGMEVTQIRFGAQTVRYNETAQRIRELLAGEIESIPELDVKIKNAGELVSFFDWLATGSLRI